MLLRTGRFHKGKGDWEGRSRFSNCLSDTEGTSEMEMLLNRSRALEKSRNWGRRQSKDKRVQERNQVFDINKSMGTWLFDSLSPTPYSEKVK